MSPSQLPTALANLPAPVQKVLAAPLPLRKLAAKGAAPGLKPSDALHVLVTLASPEAAPADASEEWTELARAAQQTLKDPPPALIRAALAGALDARALDGLARSTLDEEIVAQVIRHADVSTVTLLRLAHDGSERLTELLATNEARLLQTPALIEALYKNPRTRMSTADRIVELAIRNGLELEGIPAFREIVQALAGELVFEASDEPTPDDEAFAECADTAVDEGEAMFELDDATGNEQIKPTYEKQKVAFDKLTISGRIRRAQVGKSSDRSQAFRDPSPLVRKAAAKSDLLTEAEVLQITTNRSTNDDVLRVLGTDRDWTRHHTVKLNLVMNPRTPYDVAARFVSFLRDHELRQVAQSRDVPGNIVLQAKQQLQKKGR